MCELVSFSTPWHDPEANSERFEGVKAKLDELRSYLYANRESVRGYAEAYRNGERISNPSIADSDGSNISRVRLWKLQKLADETGLHISVCHLPPGTSKWNYGSGRSERKSTIIAVGMSNK